jgi:cellulose synthase operon protein C
MGKTALPRPPRPPFSVPLRSRGPDAGPGPRAASRAADQAREKGGSRPAPSHRPDSPEEVVLRLAIGREGVGLELASPAPIGCMTVTELTASLPGARFPVDVSGGVQRFRHRHGDLQTLHVGIGARAIERWAAPLLRGIVDTRVPDVWVGFRPSGAIVSVAAANDAEASAGTARAAVVAFEVDVLAEQADLVLVVKRARGADLPATPTAMAIACVEAVLRGLAKREGAAFIVQSGARAIARTLLPRAGARVPSTEGVAWAALAVHGDTWNLHALRGAVPAAPGEEAVRAREIAALLRAGDDALVGGDGAAARTLYLEVMERTPRHAEIASRILQIDARTPGRAEAALATLAESRQGGDGDPPLLGTTPGELLLEVGDTDAAVASLERVGETEPTPQLAARAFELAGRTTRDPEAASRWLDRAIARAPRSVSARWLRVGRRLELGRLEDALADVEHLDALVRATRGKVAVWVRAGRAWQSANLGAHAGPLFERALRYAPDEPQALAGLGAALVGEGRAARGVAVLARAIGLAEANNVPTGPMIVALARGLAEHLDDLPTAIARVSTIPAEAPEGPLARGLEGRWRARLGDVAGAALAFARLRELAASFAGPEVDARTASLAALLGEAADLHRLRLHDFPGAQRNLSAALRLCPHDADLRRSYREIGDLVATRTGDTGATPSGRASASQVAPEVHRPLEVDFTSEPAREPTEDDARASARVDELTRRIHADPKDDAAADALAPLLEALGRGHELLALLSARLEEAAPERYAVLAPQARAALVRLAAQAERAGRLEEAALYRSAMAGLPS